MGIMAIGRIIVLSALFAQTLSAPTLSGCIESCNFHHTSYQNRHTLGGYQDHASLIQENTNLNDHDYAKPGNWTERNQYGTDNGHGKVHEERGQYVEGSKRVRYYKKNFTSSYGTGNVNEANAAELGELSGQHRYDSVHIPSNQHFDSQSTYGQLGQTVTKESGYNRVHNQQAQSSLTRIDSKSERLEDFGEHSGFSQVNQHVPNINTQAIDMQHHVETTPDNWSRVDSYRTDGGNGRVFEEEGQYVTGPKKVRYFKKNYTSSYSTSGVPQTNIESVTLNELQRNLHKELNNFRREFHEASSTGHTASTMNIGSTMGTTQKAAGFHSHDLQTAESDSYNQQLGYRRVPSTGTVHYTNQQRETFTDTRQQLPYTYPTASANTYGTESQRTYQSHGTHVSGIHSVPQSSHMPSTYVQVPITRDSYQALHNAHSSSGRHIVDETQRAEGTHQSSVAQNQLLTENSQRVYNPSQSYGNYPSGHGETRQYEEHWRSSSHAGKQVAPQHTTDFMQNIGHTDRTHYDRDAYNEQRGRYHSAQGYNSHAHTSESNYNSGYRTSSGQLVTGSLDLGQVAPGADCTEETQQYQQETRYHRKYKRDDHHGNVQQHQTTDNEDFTQQTQGSDDLTQQTSGKIEFGQQTVGNHHLEDLTQQTEGQLELGQQTIDNQHQEDLTQQSEHFTQQTQGSDDLTQQTSGKIEFGQQTVGNQHLEDLTQQTEGQLEFGQQTVGNQHQEDLTQQSEHFTQQTQGSDDLTQQTSGKIELGQQTVGNQHLEDLTQQTEGQLEFGQQTVGNQQQEDLTQQNEHFTQQTQGSDDLTQQTSGKIEFGQQTVGNQHLEDLTQQTEGQLEFGQQTVDNQHQEDLTQQSEHFTQHTQGSDDLTQQTSGKIEFGQQTVGNQHLEDLTQQTEGQLEFGQQTVGNQHQEDLIQQSEHFTQHTQESDDLTQQTSGKIEFGQQTIGNQHLEDLTQQTEGQLEFGQQTVGNQHQEDLTQQNEHFTQQTQGSDDLTQQTSGKIEFGQQTVGNQHLEDLTQQTEGQLEFGQQTIDQHNQHQEDLTQQIEQFAQRTPRSDGFTHQTVDKIEVGQQAIDNQHLKDSTQQSEELAQQTAELEDFTQQTIGKLEFSHQVQSIDKSTKPKNQHLEEFNQQSEDLTQQMGEFNDFTQQTMGQLEFGQQIQQPYDSSKLKTNNQHLEDFTQQNEDLTQKVGGFDNFAQQTGHLEYGQRDQQKPSFWPEYNTQHSEQFFQKNGWDNLSQQSHQYPSYNNNNDHSKWQLEQISQKTDLDQDFTQQTDHNQQLPTIVTKPAAKPKPRQRHQKHDDSIPPHIDGTDTNVDDIFKPIKITPEADIDNFHKRTINRITHPESNYHRANILYAQSQGSGIFDNNEENMHWVHKSNDATVGLQWHYTYHPSDLTNIEGSHNSYYPHHNIDSMSQQTEDAQQSRPFDFSQQETQDKHTLENMHQNSYTSQSSQMQNNEYKQLGSFQQIETSRFDNQFNQNSEQTPSRVIPLQHSQNSQQTIELEKQSTQTTEQSEYKIESRILEAYGGGPYDASHNDDIYSRVTPNPSATLPPIDGEDPWDIREKPREMIPWTVVNKLPAVNTPNVTDAIRTVVTETTTQVIETTTTEEPPPSFWNRVGHKITSAYDKAKEKAKEIFG